jgi:hypothetical protein
MQEHDEAFLYTYLADLLSERSGWLADEMLAEIKDALETHEDEAGRLKTSRMADDIAERKQHLQDAVAWRRILADPTLLATLVRVEDEGLFWMGES